MRTRVKDFIEVSDCTSLERLITTLTAIRDSLPEGADPELKMRGDDVFGRRLSISYWREVSAKEAELNAKYNIEEPVSAELAALTNQLDLVEYEPEQSRRAA